MNITQKIALTFCIVISFPLYSLNSPKLAALAVGSYYLHERGNSFQALKSDKEALARISLDTPRPNPHIRTLEKSIKNHKSNIRGTDLVIGACALVLLLSGTTNSIDSFTGS